MSLRNALINSCDADVIINNAFSYGLDVEIYESVLVDEAIIYANNQLFTKGLPRAKYVILQDQVLNCWSSAIKVILTNSDKRANEFIKSREMSS